MSGRLPTIRRRTCGGGGRSRTGPYQALRAIPTRARWKQGAEESFVADGAVHGGSTVPKLPKLASKCFFILGEHSLRDLQSMLAHWILLREVLRLSPEHMAPKCEPMAPAVSTTTYARTFTFLHPCGAPCSLSGPATCRSGIVVATACGGSQLRCWPLHVCEPDLQLNGP